MSKIIHAAITLKRVLDVNVKITDTEALRSLSPQALQAYALDRGFTMELRKDENAYMLYSGDDEFCLLPARSDLRDYASCTQEFIEGCASMRGVSELRVWLEIVEMQDNMSKVQAK
jgi:hypothetical protein